MIKTHAYSLAGSLGESLQLHCSQQIHSTCHTHRRQIDQYMCFHRVLCPISSLTVSGSKGRKLHWKNLSQYMQSIKSIMPFWVVVEVELFPKSAGEHLEFLFSFVASPQNCCVLMSKPVHHSTSKSFSCKCNAASSPQDFIRAQKLFG